jgi:hypothetical protein
MSSSTGDDQLKQGLLSQPEGVDVAPPTPGRQRADEATRSRRLVIYFLMMVFVGLGNRIFAVLQVRGWCVGWLARSIPFEASGVHPASGRARSLLSVTCLP